MVRLGLMTTIGRHLGPNERMKYTDVVLLA